MYCILLNKQITIISLYFITFVHLMYNDSTTFSPSIVTIFKQMLICVLETIPMTNELYYNDYIVNSIYARGE